jgi:hypothetical protein
MEKQKQSKMKRKVWIVVLALVLLVVLGCVGGWVGWRLGGPKLGGLPVGRLRLMESVGRIEPARLRRPQDDRNRELARALHALLRRLDSLATDSKGRPVYDSLMRMRPGLVDSARTLVKYFDAVDY